MKTITLSDSCAAELQTALNEATPPPVEPPPIIEPPPVIPPVEPPPVTEPPPTQPPPTTGRPPIPAGFDRMIYVEADMHEFMRPIETQHQGGWTPTSLFCLSFIAAASNPPSGSGNVSCVPYPPPNQSCWREASVSEVCGDFSNPRSGSDLTIFFQVGGSSRTNYVLEAGKRYYINYKWDNSSDARLQVSWPYGVI